MQYRLKITAIRSRFKSGGCIFTGKEVDADGDFKTAGEYYVVRVDSDLVAGIEVQQGQIVNVSGPLSKYERDVNGYWLVEAQIKAQTLTIEVPSGEQIISFIASNPNFKGIGQVKANKLWNRFNTNLINLIETNDVDQLSLVLNRLDAQCLIKEWSKLKHGASMTWLLSKDIPAKLGSRLINFYGDKLQRCLEEDSYRILSFSGDWRFTDELAISVFNIDITDARRLNAAISEALHRVFMKGSTKVSQYGLYRELSELFGSHFYELKKDIDALLKVGVSNRYYIHKDRFYHPVGAYAMECFVADKVRARLDAKETLLDKLQLERRIASFQAQKKFALNQEQLDAAEMVNSNKFSVLLGSAGSGKTTVLELLCLIYKQCGFEIVQAAISAKAAKKMESSTGLKATTIASVLYRNKKYQPGQKVVLILDEASMVDLVSMYQLLLSLPEDARILLVGDTGQLMPIGPGLILHALAGIQQIPKVMLSTSNRFGSVIAHAANQVRAGVCPQFSSDLNDPLVFIDADEDKIADIVSDLFIRDPLGVQVLSSIRKGMAGTEVLNSRCQLRFTEGNQWLSYWDQDAESYRQSKFRLGDYVLCTKNMWNFELQNGSQGKIIRLLDNPRVVVSEEGYETDAIIGYIMWDDGVERALHESMLPYIDLGFAMSVHKAQGSQWDTVVIALTGNPILDRTLIYTAMTRACQKIVFVGDRKAMEKAIKNPPKVEERLVGLFELGI